MSTVGRGRAEEREQRCREAALREKITARDEELRLADAHAERTRQELEELEASLDGLRATRDD